MYYANVNRNKKGITLNLKAPEGEKQKLPVLWSSFLSGPASYSGKVNQTLVVRAINQSFAQSPYLTNK